MNINVYLNELSIAPSDPTVWNEGFDKALACLKAFANIKNDNNGETSVIIKPDVFIKIVIHPNRNFSAFLKGDRDRKASFHSVYKKACKEFLFDISESKYFIDRKDVTNSSAADSYESQKSGASTFLVNFNTSFPSPYVVITKEKDGEQTVFSYHNDEELTIKLKELGLIKEYYDTTSNIRPNPYLTILTDTSLFIPTEYGNRKNRLYRRIDEPDQLWCLDPAHRGGSVHLEVFSESQNKQIAVSCHDKIEFFRELTKQEKNRVLKKVRM